MTSIDLLPAELLERVRERAIRIDRENVFPEEDLKELQAAGYLAAFVPTSMGGPGLTTAQVSAHQQRLAGAAGATALAINMHLVWTGVARYLHDRGVHELDFVLEEALQGEVFAFGISEAGNDLVLFGSDTRAVPDANGGYSFTGRKIFTSLAPVWTRLGVHGLDSSDSANPHLVFAFLGRTDDVVTSDDWDVLGMRGTQSRTTTLNGAHAEKGRVVRRVPVGQATDPLIFAIFAVFEVLLASVYSGIAQRALELSVETVRNRRSKKTSLPYSEDPDIRWRIADMAMTIDAIEPQLIAVASAIDGGHDYGANWFRQLSGLKHRAVVGAKAVVDNAMLTAGGSGFSNSSELPRLYRDVIAGFFHPSDPESAHSTVAAAVLGQPGS